jgi:hypothetical protein
VDEACNDCGAKRTAHRPIPISDGLPCWAGFLREEFGMNAARMGNRQVAGRCCESGSPGPVDLDERLCLTKRRIDNACGVRPCRSVRRFNAVNAMQGSVTGYDLGGRSRKRSPNLRVSDRMVAGCARSSCAQAG